MIIAKGVVSCTAMCNVSHFEKMLKFDERDIGCFVNLISSLWKNKIVGGCKMKEWDPINHRRIEEDVDVKYVVEIELNHPGGSSFEIEFKKIFVVFNEESDADSYISQVSKMMTEAFGNPMRVKRVENNND